MNNKIAVSIPLIVLKLQSNAAINFDAFLGFDACIDNIVRVVKDKDENNKTAFYTNIRLFGEFLISRENKSCGIELQTRLSKAGGNMVITANALGNLWAGILEEIMPDFATPF